MAAVAAAGGVSRTTLHAHFATREALLRAVADRALEDCEAATRVPTRSRVDDGGLLDLVERLVPVGPQLGFLWRTPSFDHDPELGRRWSGVEAAIGAVVAASRARGALPGGRPDWWDVAALLALVYVAAESIYQGRLAPLQAPQFILATLRGQGASI